MSDIKTFYYLITSQLILLLLVSSYAIYMTELHCPEFDEIRAQFDAVPFNETSPLTGLSNTWALLGLMFSGCAGIPWWIYIIVFVPSFIAIVVYVVPFIGS